METRGEGTSKKPQKGGGGQEFLEGGGICFFWGGVYKINMFYLFLVPLRDYVLFIFGSQVVRNVVTTRVVRGGQGGDHLTT